jgi:hypothetical protein
MLHSLETKEANEMPGESVVHVSKESEEYFPTLNMKEIKMIRKNEKRSQRVPDPGMHSSEDYMASFDAQPVNLIFNDGTVKRTEKN